MMHFFVQIWIMGARVVESEHRIDFGEDESCIEQQGSRKNIQKNIYQQWK